MTNPAPPRWLAPAGWLLVLCVTAAIITAFVTIVGSPAEARRKNADEQRSGALVSIAQRVHEYYAAHHQLPANLGALSLRPEDKKDPVSNAPYEYRQASKNTFQLCAVFETDTTKSNPTSYSPYSYYGDAESDSLGRHARGRVCFTLPAKHP